MLIERTPKPKSQLQTVIDDLLTRMADEDETSDDYAKMADQLAKLYKLKEVDSKKRVSPDTLALIIGNLAGILVIVGYERAHVVTSKALQFAGKLR